MDYRIISIGSLSRHPLWPKPTPPRTAHATTTLIQSDDRVILVDPALPREILLPRLAERSGLDASDITDVFLTSFRPAHRRGLIAFDHANWWISHAEREAIGVNLVAQHQAHADSDPQTADLIRQEIALLQRCQPAADSLAPHVDLFPLPGPTPGHSGLLLTLPQITILLASDAIPTIEHLEKGQILSDSFDLQQARESFAEAIEIADWIIPGHDNLTPNLTRRPF